MNYKIIREGNAFYETDDQCMKKKERKSASQNNLNPPKNTDSSKPNNLFKY